MKRVKISVLAVGGMVLCLGAPAWADLHLTPSSAMSFQDEPSFQTADHTALLTELDGQWAPSPVPGYPRIDYYATGRSIRYWDAVSLSFDLSQIGAGHHVVSANLRFYAQQGDYVDTAWHHYEVLEGAFDSTHEDDHPMPAWPDLVDFGSYGSNGIVGWLEAPIPTSWITSNAFDVTLRLWNARVDKVELDVVTAPLPGAVILGLLGFGTAGTGLLGRLMRRRTSIDA
jgi:hypothetical protein